MGISAVTEARYRAARLEDLVDIEAIETTQFAELSYPYFALRQFFDLHGPHWIVAELDGAVCGYAMVAFGPEEVAWLMGLGVQKQSQGRGLGSGLMERVLELCREERREQVLLTVRPTNQAAYKLYEQTGFRRIDHEERYFGSGQPRDVLVHRLGR